MDELTVKCFIDMQNVDKKMVKREDPQPSRRYLLAIIILSIFGQLFFSTLAFQFSIPNRVIMILMRSSTSLLCCYSIVKFGLVNNRKCFYSPWVISLILFWLIYFGRLIIDSKVYEIETAIPIWELVAWGIGSSLIPCIATYILAQDKDNIPSADRIVSVALPMVVSSAIFFSISPGLTSTIFQLPTLNPINSGHASASLALIGASSLISKSNQIVFNRRDLLAISAVVIGSYLCIYSATRSAVISLLIPLFISTFVYRGGNNRGISKKIVYLIGSFIVLGLVISIISPILMNKLVGLFSHTTVITRIQLIKFAINSFFSHPIFGIGFNLHSKLQLLSSQWGESLYFTHNYLAESLALGGITLTIPLVFCFVISFKRILKVVSVEKERVWILLVMLQAILYVMTTGHFGDVPMFWLIIGISAGFDRRKDINIESNK